MIRRGMGCTKHGVNLSGIVSERATRRPFSAANTLAADGAPSVLVASARAP